MHADRYRRAETNLLRTCCSLNDEDTRSPYLAYSENYARQNRCLVRTTRAGLSGSIYFYPSYFARHQIFTPWIMAVSATECSQKIWFVRTSNLYEPPTLETSHQSPIEHPAFRPRRVAMRSA